MLLLWPFKNQTNDQGRYRESGNMLLITGVIASAVAVAGGKVMLDRSVAQRKANQMAENMKRAKEIPGSAAMVAKALISLPGDVAKNKGALWTTQNIKESSPQKILPIFYPVPYVEGAHGASALAATTVKSREAPTSGANWKEFKTGHLSASVEVYTNDSTRASASNVSEVLGDATTNSGAKKIVGGGNTIKRTKSTVTYKFRNCNNRGQTSSTFTGIYCARAEIESENYAGATKGNDNKLGVNKATAELGIIEPPPVPTCNASIKESKVRPGESFTLSVTARGVVVGYKVMYSGQILSDAKWKQRQAFSFADWGSGRGGWSDPTQEVTGEIAISTATIADQLASMVADGVESLTIDVRLKGIPDLVHEINGGNIPEDVSCSAQLSLPGPVACEAESFSVTRTIGNPRICNVSLKKDEGIGQITGIHINGISHTGDSSTPIFENPSFDSTRKWTSVIDCGEDYWSFQAKLQRKFNDDILSEASCYVTPALPAHPVLPYVEELDPICSRVVSYLRTPARSCQLKVERDFKSHSKVKVLAQNRERGGRWSDTIWETTLACDPFPHSVPVKMTRIDRLGNIKESSCGSAELKASAALCENPSAFIGRLASKPGFCQMTVRKYPGVDERRIKEVRREYTSATGSWSGDVWTSNEFSCPSHAAEYKAQLLDEVGAVHECGTATLPVGSPSCNSLTAERQSASSTTCNVTITKGAFSAPIGQVFVNGSAGSGSWSGDTWRGTTSCPLSGASIGGRLIGADSIHSVAHCDTVAVPAASPTLGCSMTATRTSPTSSSCNVTLTASSTAPLDPATAIREVLVNNNPVMRNGTWNGLTWSGTTSCSASGATITGHVLSYSESLSCGSIPVPALPLKTCSVTPSHVGVVTWLKKCDKECWTWNKRSRSWTKGAWFDVHIKRGIVLPDDVQNISITATKGFVDDWTPRISINDIRLKWVNKEDPREPYNMRFDTDISAWLKGGNNEVYVGSWSIETNWSISFQIEGTYQTFGECNHDTTYHLDDKWK